MEAAMEIENTGRGMVRDITHSALPTRTKLNPTGSAMALGQRIVGQNYKVPYATQHRGMYL